MARPLDPTRASEAARLDRRALLRGALVGGGAWAGGALLGGALLSPDARARLAPWARGEVGSNLVLLQLTGGNDGLSMVVPFADDAYGRARRTTRLKEREVLRLDDTHGLNPGLVRLRRWYDRGGLAIVEGCGYPDPIRSHFRSYEVWHTAHHAGHASGDGWIGRLTEAGCAADAPPELVVHVGREAPYSVHSRAHPAIVLSSPTGYRWFGEEREQAAYAAAGERAPVHAPDDDLVDEGSREHAPEARRHSGRDAALARLRGVLDDARASSGRIRAAAASYRTEVEYPRTRLAADLRDTAALLGSGLGTRVVSVTTGGFDTHAGQRDVHDRLMVELDGALDAFLRDLATTEGGRRTTVVVLSEFGRRVRENASKGTDHGKAGPMLVLGHGVRGGLHGAPPSLEDLDAGDLRFTTDFRSVYGAVVEHGFGVPMEDVLGRRYPTLDLLG